MRENARTGTWVRQAIVPLALAACAVLLLGGGFAMARPGAGHRGLGHIACWVLLLAADLLCAVRTIRFKIRSGRADRTQPRIWSIETGLLLGISAQALAQLTGGVRSPLQPLTYLVGAGLMIALPMLVAAPLVAALIALDAALFIAGGAMRTQWPLWLAQTAFTVLFASLYHALLAAQLWRAGRAERTAVRRRVNDAEERARELRLVATAEARAQAEDDENPESLLTSLERETLAAVSEMESALKGALTVAEAALKPHTVAVFLLSPDGQTLRLRECVSPTEKVFLGPLSAREGALGAVLSAGRTVRLGGDGPALSYYEGRAPVSCFLGAPLSARAGGDPFVDAADGANSAPDSVRPGQSLGVLIADRATPFSSDEERALAALAREVARAIESERLLFAVRREKEEKARFFRALEALNRTSSAADAAQAAVEHARALCSTLDLCAVTLREGGDGAVPSFPPPIKGTPPPSAPPRTQMRARHRILAAVGDGASALQGLTFADNPGLVSNVVRLGAPLPGRDLGAMDRVVIFDGNTVVRGLAALKIFPLRAGDAVVGTLVCGSRTRHGLPASAQGELSMLALQAAEALVRARLFEETERMATTDGLTGLLNRRAMDDLLKTRFAEATRYKRPLAFVLFDVDHFKKVNDVHGHPAGDTVLRGVAQEAAGQARESDRVARYGGEEMALILPETDLTGAMAIAERIRIAVSNAEHATETGTLKVTVSAGVSILAPGIESPAQLIEAADQALYKAKQGGRNRCVSARDRVAA